MHTLDLSTPFIRRPTTFLVAVNGQLLSEGRETFHEGKLFCSACRRRLTGRSVSSLYQDLEDDELPGMNVN